MRKKLNVLLIASIFIMGLYHIIMSCIKMNVLNVDPESLYLFYPIYNIPLCILIIVLLTYLVKSSIFPKKVYRAIPYFGLKILGSLLIYIPKYRDFINGKGVDLWLVLITSLIVAILWVVKLINKNGR